MKIYQHYLIIWRIPEIGVPPVLIHFRLGFFPANTIHCWALPWLWKPHMSLYILYGCPLSEKVRLTPSHHPGGGVLPKNHQLIITIYIVPVLHIIFHHHHQFYYILLSPVLQFHYYNSIITISVALPYIIQFIFYHLYYPQLVITITYSYINQYKPIEKPI